MGANRHNFGGVREYLTLKTLRCWAQYLVWGVRGAVGDSHGKTVVVCVLWCAGTLLHTFARWNHAILGITGKLFSQARQLLYYY